jgi:ribose transport system permease protein
VAALGEELMLQSIAAAILGGVSLRGGVGRVEFVVIGTLFLGVVTNGMNLIRVNSKLQMIVIGIIMIVAVAVDLLKRKEVLE